MAEEGSIASNANKLDAVDLCYSVVVDGKLKRIVKNVNFGLEAGDMCALMGPSGAGKSTLLDVLAERKLVGTWSGDVYVIGAPRTALFKRESAYVLQEDVHIPTLTVEETLKYAAWTRVEENVSELVRSERIAYLIETLGLTHVRHSRVGDAMSKGISGGQLRRLSIAVEIVALPPLIFLDEPTSGLDSSIALEVMSTVRNIINKERIGVTTIHQPSNEIFALFDKLVLMSAGRLVYFGAAAEAAAHFTQPRLGYKFEKTGQKGNVHRNPADFILEVCCGQCLPEGCTGPRQPQELELLYKTSPSAHRSSLSTSRLRASTNTIATTQQQQNALSQIQQDSRVYATTMWTQLKMLMHRTWVAKMRDYVELLTDLAKAIGAGLLVGIFYLGKGNLSEPFYIHGILTGDVLSFISFLFVYVLFSMVMNATAIPSICRMTVQYKHDLVSNAYAPIPYCLAQLLTTLPLRFVFHLLNVIILYWMVDLKDNVASFLYFLCMTFLSSTIAYISALALAANVNDGAKTLAIFPTQFLVWAIFTGFVITYSSLPEYWKWATFITYPKWIFEGLMVNYFEDYDTDDRNGFFENGNGDVLSQYDFDDFNQFDAIWISVMFALGFSVLFYAGLLPERNRIVHVQDAGDALSVLSVYRATRSTFSVGTFSLTRMTNMSMTARATVNSKTSPSSVVELKGWNGSLSSAPPSSSASLSESGRHSHLIFEDPVLQHAPLLGVEDYRQSCGDIEPAKGCKLVFSNIYYAVPNKADRSKPISLLQGVTGRAMPGDMVALMGASGAGKSTLLDVLAQRKSTGTITGEITYNGCKDMHSVAYVMQDSAHIGILTVKETLYFAAALRLGTSVTAEKKNERVSKIMDMLGLSRIANSILGTSNVRGISGGQLKRVSIGVEIVHLPDLMFLDEPTTGLDSSTSWEVMSAVRNLANQNRTVLCTIHQPSADTYSLFNSLLLLAAGKVIYYGDAAAVVDYFAHSSFEFHFKPGSNPADFLVAVAGSFIPAADGRSVSGAELAEYYLTSSACKETMASVDSADVSNINPLLHASSIATHSNAQLTQQSITAPHDENLENSSVGLFHQIYVLLQRRLVVMRRDYMTVVGPAVRELLVGVLLGSVFFQLDTGRDCDNDCYQDRLSLFFFSIVLMLMDHLDDATALVDERLVFYRERGSKAYGTVAYFVSFSLLHFPQMALNTLLYTAAMYPMSELRPDFHYVATFYCFLLLVNFVSFFLAVTVAAASFNTEVILNNAVPILIVNILYAGYLMPIPSMPDWQGSWIPYVVFFRFGFQGMVLNEMSGNDALAFHSVYIDNLGFNDYSVTECGWILVLFLVLQAVAFLVVLYFVDFEQR